MENVVLVIHLILALCLIGVVLLQRSEGGGLGMGSGGGGGGVMSARSAGTALGKLTWIFAIGFIATSIGLTVIAAQKSANSSVVDRLGTQQSDPAAPADTPLGGDLLPPPVEGSGDTAPRAD